MPGAGRPPKSTAVKKLQGTHRPHRDVPNEVQSPIGAPPKPDNLPKGASEKWDALVPLLLERRTLSPEDGEILEAFCRTYDQWVTLAADAAKRVWVGHPKGELFGEILNPAGDRAIRLEVRLTQMGDRLGLNASARSRISARPVPDGDKPKAGTAEGFFFGDGPAPAPAKAPAAPPAIGHNDRGPH